MKKLLLVLLLPAVLAGCSSNSKSTSSTMSSTLNAATPVLEGLMKGVPGLSQAQAALGAGSMLGYAKSTMPADQFNQISNAIPGTDALIADAVAKGLPKPLNSMTEVSSFLTKNGLTQEQVNMVGSSLNGMLKGKVPTEVANGFTNALGFKTAGAE
jgi:hypothetical protein